MWNYTDKVMDHFMNPRNVGEIADPDGVAEVGNAACGDALKLTFKLDENGRIAEAKFRTFGCASAIASSSALTELIKGMTLDEAAKVTNQDIVNVLGTLPEAKMHCSVMGMEALAAAIANYKGEPNPFENDDEHEGRIVCRCEQVTEGEILQAIRENPPARDIDGVKRRTRSGMGRCQGGFCQPYVAQLIARERGIPIEKVTKSGGKSYILTGVTK